VHCKRLFTCTFVRKNLRLDCFKVKQFHHAEFCCTVNTNSAPCFSWVLGMPIVAKSKGGSTLMPGWSYDHFNFEKKIIIIYKV